MNKIFKYLYNIGGCLMMLISVWSFAFSGSSLLFTHDQLAQRAMQSHQFTQAATLFRRPDWKAAAAYRAGNYALAAEIFSTIHTEQGYYNYGNSLAYLKQYQAAIHAYDNTLKLNPKNADAIYNRALVSKLLKKDSRQPKPTQNRSIINPKFTEEQQSRRQWLHVVPDDPGGLLRAKLMREHLHRQSGFK